MSIPLISKSDSDVSSNASWSVISESEEPEFISKKKNILENDSDSQNKDVRKTEDQFFDICDGNSSGTVEESDEDNCLTGFLSTDEASPTVKEAQIKNKTKKMKTKSRKMKKNRKVDKAETLGLLSIAASVLTITGLTFLCMLFPQNFEKETLQNIEKAYVDINTTHNVDAETFLNKTSDMFGVLNEADFFRKMQDTMSQNDPFQNDVASDEICVADEINNEYNNFESYPVNHIPSVDIKSLSDNINLLNEPEYFTPHPSVQNKTLNLIKSVKRILMDPTLQIFVCSVLQDICLIKLVNQLNKQHMEKTADKSEIYSEKTNVEGTKKRKLQKVNNAKCKQPKIIKNSNKLDNEARKDGEKFENLLNSKLTSFKKISELKDVSNSHHSIKLRVNNNKKTQKSDRQRRFEELDNRWEAAGQIHRQKIQEIKENYKNEISRIKENEKECTLRREKVQLLRESYIERLKHDREKYLQQLHKLREARQKIMNSVCHQKNVDINLKDASVGNYAVVLPETYNFKQKLQLIKNKNNEVQFSLPSIPTASLPKLGAVKNSKFIKYQSIPNIPNQEVAKEDISKGIIAINNNREEYLEKVKKYYEKKSKYLQKVAQKNEQKSKSNVKTAETLGNALIEDMLSRMISKISEPKKAFLRNFKREETSKISEPSKSDSDTSNTAESGAENNSEKESIDREFKLVVNRKAKKRDLYDLAFDEKSKKVKQDEIIRWNVDRRERIHQSPQRQMLSKNDQQKSYKEKIINKGHM